MAGQLQRRGIESHRQADTTDLDVNRHGRGANFVAMTGFVPVVFMNSPKNSSEVPKPYTCHHGTSGVAHSRKKAHDYAFDGRLLLPLLPLLACASEAQG